MPLKEAELSRPKRVLVAITLLYAALGIGVTRIVLDLYSGYPITGPPWLMTMVNKTGIAWLLPIVLLLPALVIFTFITGFNLPEMNRAAGSGNRLIRPNPRIPPDSSLDSAFGFLFSVFG
jgi:hypothetical protein